MHTSTDIFDAVKRCFDAYGANPARWPAEARKRFGALALSDELAAARREAETLDGFLGAATPPHMSADLKNRIMAQYQSPPAVMTIGGLVAGLFSQRRFMPAGAFAGIGALGLISGMLSANAGYAMTPEAEAYAYVYSDSVIAMAALDEEEAVQWDED